MPLSPSKARLFDDYENVSLLKTNMFMEFENKFYTDHANKIFGRSYC